jgi:hypothetical protein
LLGSILPDAEALVQEGDNQQRNAKARQRHDAIALRKPRQVKYEDFYNRDSEKHERIPAHKGQLAAETNHDKCGPQRQPESGGSPASIELTWNGQGQAGATRAEVEHAQPFAQPPTYEEEYSAEQKRQ